MYAQDHGGRYPEKLQDLVPEYLSELRLYQDKTGKLLSDWTYFPGYTEASPAKTILIVSPEPIGKYRVVTFQGGSSQAILEPEYQQLLRAQPPPASAKSASP